MIFVTIGTQNLPFGRLVKKMDEIAGKIDEEVVIQSGNTKYIPKNAKWFTFVDNMKILEFYNKADIIIAHDGAGTLLTALSLNKPTIVVPRLKKYGECQYKNKFDLAEALEKMGRVIVVYNIEELEDAVKSIKTFKYKKIEQNKTLVYFLQEIIKEFEEDIKNNANKN